MKACVVMALGLVAAGCASGGSSGGTVAENRVSDAVAICQEPTSYDTAGWAPVVTPMYSARVPEKFERGPRDAGMEIWGVGAREIGYSYGEEPPFTRPGTETTLMASCHTIVAGHPVEISLLKYKVDDNGDASQAASNTILVESARWKGPGRDAVVWIFSASRRDIEHFRQVFWTVQFAPGALQ